MICLDTCGTAGDAVCQDGGWGAFGAMCAFGTDCSDCGARLLLDPPPSAPAFPPPPLDAIDAGSDEESGGLIAGAIVGCLALVAALGAGGFYCYKKKTPPLPPANVEVVVSPPESQKC